MVTGRSRGSRGESAEAPSRRAVIRATIDLAGRVVSFDPWAVDDWAGERWVLEARPKRQLRGRATHWRLEKRGHEIVACTRYLASASEIIQMFGPDVASRFFEPGDREKEITFEIPVPIGLDFLSPETVAAVQPARAKAGAAATVPASR